MKKITFLFLLLPFFGLGQVQIGQVINGEAANDQSGKAVALSSDGSIIAISSKLNNGNGSDSGHVRVYENQFGNWVQLGQDIDGEVILDQSGDSVALSGDGTILAVGSIQNDGNGSQSGSARIFQYNGTDTWIQLGQDIDGFIANDEFGKAISLSVDGNTVAISSTRHSSFRGHVRVYNYNGANTWLQVGSDIDVAGNDQSGSSIQLSNDASRIIIGATAFNSNRGVVRVYENQSGNWVQIGQNIEGENSFDQAGFSVSISGNGIVVAVGAPFNDADTNDKGHVRIYEYDVNTWTQIGDDIDGENSTDRFGGSVSLSNDGTILVAGAVLAKNETNINSSQGHFRVFQNQSGVWMQVGTDIDGDNPGDFFGEAVSISDNGSIVAGSSLRNDNTIGNDAGHVRVYDFSAETLGVQNFLINNFSLYPNPTKNQVTIQLDSSIQLEKVIIYNTLGQVVVASEETIVNTSKLASGSYVVEVATNKGKSYKKLIIE
jgi:hypothetical protein